MIFELKQEHIDKGEKIVSHNCPFAHAIKDATGEGRVYVGELVSIIDKNRIVTHYQTSKIMWKCVKDFDLGKKIKPGKFMITLTSRENLGR